MGWTLPTDGRLDKDVGKTQPPFEPWTQISPLLTREKENSSSRRVIVYLSFPQGESVNDGIRKKYFQGREISYTLPTITTLTEKVKEMGKGCYIFSTDV